jgi:diadenosine tetraphosphate (Ap4A) HIT family hydrolase
MCASLGGGDNEYTVAVTELPFSEVRLERRSLLPGYCIVVWKFGHVAEPTELDDDAAAGYWRDVLSVTRAVEAEFVPIKINLLTLGNWVPHLHTHVVPRYRDDPAPGGPIAYQAMFADEPVAVEILKGHADRIRDALPR